MKINATTASILFFFSIGVASMAAEKTSLPGTTPVSVLIDKNIDFEVYSGVAPSKKMKALHIKVQNHSDVPLVFDGDRVQIVNSQGGTLIADCVSQAQVDAVDRPPTTFARKVSSDMKASVTAAVTLGVVQTVETIKKEYGPILGRYEWDQERRHNEEMRFGRRLLYPGDSTDGNIYFDTSTEFKGNNFTIPVQSFYEGSDQAVLSRPIEISNSNTKQDKEK